MQLAAFRIDFRTHFSLAAVSRARGLGDRILHGAEHDLAIDRLFTRDRVGDLQQFESIGANGRHWSVSLVRSLFALAQRLGNERVGKNEPGLRHVVDAQQNVVCLVITDGGTFAIGALQFTAKPFAPVDRDLHFDRSGDVEDRRERARGGFAVINVHRSVGTLGHDLYGATGKAGNADADQTITEAGGGGGGPATDTRAP